MPTCSLDVGTCSFESMPLSASLVPFSTWLSFGGNDHYRYGDTHYSLDLHANICKSTLLAESHYARRKERGISRMKDFNHRSINRGPQLDATVLARLQVCWSLTALLSAALNSLASMQCVTRSSTLMAAFVVCVGLGWVPRVVVVAGRVETRDIEPMRSSPVISA